MGFDINTGASAAFSAMGSVSTSVGMGMGASASGAASVNMTADTAVLRGRDVLNSNLGTLA